MIKLGNPNLHWGIVRDKPALPDGWRYIEREGDWLKARSPDGKLWFAGGKTLYRCKRATRWDCLRTLGRFRMGQQYIDSREAHAL